MAVDVLKALPKLSLLAPFSDLVMVHWLYPYGAAVARMRNLWQKPVVVVLHSVSPLAFRMLPFTRKAVENADLFIAVSGSVKAGFLNALPAGLRTLARAKTRVIPMGVPALPGTLRRTGRGEPLRCLFLGRLVKIKGPDIAVQAVSGLQGVTLTVAGEGPMRNRLQAMADLENTRFTGLVPRGAVPGLLASHDCLLLPSRRLFGGRREGQPVVLKEAVISGMPVIATPFGGPSEFIAEHLCGETVDRTDKTAFRQAITGLRDQPERLAAFSENALNAAAKLTWNHLLPQWMTALEELV